MEGSLTDPLYRPLRSESAVLHPTESNFVSPTIVCITKRHVQNSMPVTVFIVPNIVGELCGNESMAKRVTPVALDPAPQPETLNPQPLADPQALRPSQRGPV